MTKAELEQKVSKLEQDLKIEVKKSNALLERAKKAEELNEHHMQQMALWSDAYGKLAEEIDSIKDLSPSVFNVFKNYTIVKLLSNLVY